MAKTRVAVLFGGVSSEHEISCISAAAIVDNIDKDKYEVFKIGITKRGRWLLYPGGTDKMRDGSWDTFEDCVHAFISPDSATRGIVTSHEGSFDAIKLDAVFPVLHGKGGEDGTVQGLLELAQIPYVGCGVGASADCMDKCVANTLFEAANIPHTPWTCVTRDDIDDVDDMLWRMSKTLSFPVFVKPSSAGSSIGVTKVNSREELQSALRLAAAHDHKVIVEKAVQGREVECAVLGNTQLLCTLPGEIVSCNEEIYDYDAKYKSGDDSKLYIPARLSDEKLQEIKELALRAYKALGCQGLSRVDFFVEEDTGNVLLSEINTMPGFTSISMYPKLMENMGISFTDLIDRLIELALERSGQ